MCGNAAQLDLIVSPYQKPRFYDDALADGRHRDIVGGRWDETGRAQMVLLRDHGLRPDHVLLDIGAGSLRLGCKAVPYLKPGHYWATDASRALMLAGHGAELVDPARLDPAHLVEDADFAYPGVPDTVTHAIAFGVFPHLPDMALSRALAGLARFPALDRLLFTVFLAPDGAEALRQRDGVVTHADRAPRHVTEARLLELTQGWTLTRDARQLPRGQVAFAARLANG